MAITTLVRGVLGITVGLAVIYISFIAILTIPYFQDHVIYLHRIKLTWGQDTNQPERWGFLRNQVTPFSLRTPDGESLHAWHVLPLGLYHRHETELCQEPSGLVTDITSRHSFKLLHDDPKALLVLYLHGAAGTLGSGYRPPSYKAISSLHPSRIHILAIDYRGFGDYSTGWPSESGLLTDALTAFTWATQIAGIPSSRIVIFSQSIGTAVALSLADHLVTQEPPTYFAGLVLVAPFTDVEKLTATYRIAGTIPLLSPVARYPSLLRYFNTFIHDKWDSNARIISLIRHYIESESPKYHIEVIHAEDDYDIAYTHSEELFAHALSAANLEELYNEGISKSFIHKAVQIRDLGNGGRVVSAWNRKGIVRLQVLKWGFHDRIMGFGVVGMAVGRAFGLEET